LSQISYGHPFHGIPTKLIGDASADPTELFDHYDAFAFWATKRIFARNEKLKTLDVGSVKMMSAMLSTMHDVTSLVLANCGDSISGVTYVKHDVSEKLPFPNNTFDVFTSMASLPLVGLSRYGDKLDAGCLTNLVAELGRVMKPNADLLFSMCLGKNVLHFNNAWFFDMPKLEQIFADWRIVDHLVDRHSSPSERPLGDSKRFSKDTSVEDMRIGDYRVVFLHLKR
jgi:SAM-dependent methyltransferase